MNARSQANELVAPPALSLVPAPLTPPAAGAPIDPPVLNLSTWIEAIARAVHSRMTREPGTHVCMHALVAATLGANAGYLEFSEPSGKETAVYRGEDGSLSLTTAWAKPLPTARARREYERLESLYSACALGRWLVDRAMSSVEWQGIQLSEKLRLAQSVRLGLALLMPRDEVKEAFLESGDVARVADRFRVRENDARRRLLHVFPASQRARLGGDVWHGKVRELRARRGVST